MDYIKEAKEIVLNENKKIHSAGVVLISNGQYLRVHAYGKPDNASFWGVPKGMVDSGESHIQAAARELMEETGLKVSPSKLKLIGEGKYKPWEGTQKILTLYAYEADNLQKRKFKSNSFFEVDGKKYPEVDKFEWVDLDNIDGYVHYVTAEILNKYKKR